MLVDSVVTQGFSLGATPGHRRLGPSLGVTVAGLVKSTSKSRREGMTLNGWKL